MKAVILAGGKGSRFLPLTETIPKALIPIGEKTLIELAIEQLPKQIDTVIITTKYLGNTIEEKIGTEFNGGSIWYAPQPPEKDGTWPAFYAAREYITDGEQFCVLGCDDFFKTEELEKAIVSNKNGMGITKTHMPAKYHGIDIENGVVKGLQRHQNENREELLEDYFANGFFLLDASVFSFDPIKLIDGEYGLPQTLIAHTDYPLSAHYFEYWQPCNTFDDLEKVKDYDSNN